MTSMPEPRSRTSTFWSVFGATAVPFGLLMAIFTKLGVMEGAISWSMWEGIAFGVLMGLILSGRFTGKTLKVSFKSKKEFLNEMLVKLSQIGYHQESSTVNFMTFKPSFQAGLIAGRITVLIEKNEAVVVGPRIYIDRVFEAE